MNESQIFTDALKLASASERAAYLDAVCAGDAQLRAGVEALLQAHASDPVFLEKSVGSFGATVDSPAARSAPSQGEAAGTVIGPYKLIEQIGEGGMGTVWMAQQTEPVKRLVAVKLIKAGMDSKQVIARFEAERQALALMDHPNIARVLEAGTTGAGRPYFVMDLVKGVPITKYCDEHHLTPRQRLELFVPVCQAVQHAHQKGIIHRDLKPSNVLVALYDGKPVPKVIDFGVAKAAGQPLTDKTLVTGFGNIVGTLEYMSPEQAEVNQLDIDTRSDIYSLGVLLYELLAGSPPFTKKNLEKAGMLEMLRVIREQEPSKPSTKLSTAGGLPTLAANRGMEPAKLTKLVRGELDWIVMKALEKNRNRRYETANGFAMDVQCYLADEPVQACPPSAGYRIRKFARKHRTMLATVAAFAFLLTAGAGLAIWQAARATVAERAATANEGRAVANEQVAQEQKREVLAANEKLRRAKYISDMNLARLAWEESNLVRTQELLDQHRTRSGEADPRGFEWHFLNRLLHGNLLTVKAHDGSAKFVSYMPDGKRLISCGTAQPRRAMELRNVHDEIKLWDATTGTRLPLQLQEATDKIFSGTLSRDGKQFAGGGRDRAVRVWNLETGELITLQGHTKEWITHFAFSLDGKRLVSVAGMIDDPNPRSMELRIWDLAARKAELILDTFPILGNAPTFSPDGNQLAVANYLDGSVMVLDATTGREAFSCTVQNGEGQVVAVAYSPDGKCLASCGRSGLHIWDVATHKCTASWPIATVEAHAIVFSPDGKRVAICGIEGLVELCDVATGQQILDFKGHAGFVFSIAFSPDGTHLASAGIDGTLRLWDTTSSRVPVTIPRSSQSFHEIDLGPDGQTLITGILTRSIQLWSTATGKPRGAAIESPHNVIACDLTADSKLLYVSDEGKNVMVWDIESGRELHTFSIEAVSNYVTALSSDGKWYAHSGRGGTIQVRNAQTGDQFRTIQGFGDTVHCLTFSPDGSRLLGADTHGVLKIWDIATGGQVMTTRLDDFFIRRIRFSSDGKRLAVVGLKSHLAAGAVEVLDAERGTRVLPQLGGHSLVVHDGVFSPDGKRLATGSTDNTIRVWELSTGQEILILKGHRSIVRAIRFTSDGRRLISASTDRTIRVWDATPVPE